MSKVIVGLSGGVDSAVCAYLLKEAGHKVTGVTLRTWEGEDGASRCCEIDDARSVCMKLGIRYCPWNTLSCFREMVTEPFIEEYLRGRTPNPCVDCNRYVKWDRMLQIADIFSAEYVATGHYAEIVRKENGRYTVRRPVSAEKDQTYMLYQLTQQMLARTLMPLWNLTKTEVRRIASEAGLSVAEKPDSQEICFVPDGHYSEFIEKHADPARIREGYFVDEEGNVLGPHKGITHYTVGQRRGLGIAAGYHLYVTEIRPETGEIVLGREESLLKNEILCRDVNYLSIPGIEPGEEIPALVRIRYRHRGEQAVLLSEGGGRVRVRFAAPVRGAAPGQSAVFYDADGCVIGGGKIY